MFKSRHDFHRNQVSKRNMSDVFDQNTDRKMPKTILDLSDLEYYGKKVLMRVDFNVSINNDGIIGEDYRIRMTIPTIVSNQTRSQADFDVSFR